MQNEAFLLQCLAAQRSKYTTAKKFNIWKMRIILISSIASFTTCFIKCYTVIAVLYLFTIIVLIAVKYLDGFIAKFQKEAAQIQQYFDTSLYSCVLEENKESWGHIMSEYEITDVVSKYRQNDLSEFKNWYSDYSSITPIEQIFYCQRENICWGNELKSSFLSL